MVISILLHRNKSHDATPMQFFIPMQSTIYKTSIDNGVKNAATILTYIISDVHGDITHARTDRNHYDIIHPHNRHPRHTIHPARTQKDYLEFSCYAHNVAPMQIPTKIGHPLTAEHRYNPGYTARVKRGNIIYAYTHNNYYTIINAWERYACRTVCPARTQDNYCILLIINYLLTPRLNYQY